MILFNILKICSAAIVAAIIGSAAIILIATIIYFAVSVITSLIQTYKDVKAKQQANKFLKNLTELGAVIEKAAEKKKTDSR